MHFHEKMILALTLFPLCAIIFPASFPLSSANHRPLWRERRRP